MTQRLEDAFFPQPKLLPNERHEMLAAQSARHSAARRQWREQCLAADTPQPRPAAPHPYGLWTLATLTSSGLMASLLWAFEHVA